jgi:hypothetical protein
MPNGSSNTASSQIVEDFSSRLDDRPMLKHEVIDAHHRNMVKYSTAQDPGYRKVVAALRDYMNDLGHEADIERACK